MGKLDRKDKREGGFILIDVLVALLIATISFIVIFSNVALAARQTVHIREKLYSLISARNETIEQKHVTFSTK